MNVTDLSAEAPAIAVLLPVYNGERYLRAAVKSVLAQTFTDFELLALDDGSKDGSLAILQEFAAADGRIQVVSRENRGLVTTLNELIGKARAPYLARMDADDICRPQRFEKQIAYLQANPACVAVGSRVFLMDADGGPIGEILDTLTHEDIDTAHMFAMNGSRICHPAVMMRKDAVERAGLYRNEYADAEDLDLWLRLAEAGGKLANLPDVLLDYRLHANSICHARGNEQRSVSRQATMAAWDRRGMTDKPRLPDVVAASETIADAHRKWAWWALLAGNVKTARKHASKAFVKDPFNIENLRVLACAIRGH